MGALFKQRLVCIRDNGYLTKKEEKTLGALKPSFQEKISHNQKI